MQEAGRLGRCYTTMNSKSNSKCNSANKQMANNNETNYFLSAPNQDNNKRSSAEITKQLQRDFENIFSRIGCFTCSLQVKLDSKPCQTPLRCVVYDLQKPFKEESELTLTARHHNATRCMDGTAEWCNSLVLVPKPNANVRICLSLARLYLDTW